VKVWITRTEPGASRLADKLRCCGFTALVNPVLGIEKLPLEPTRSTETACVRIVLSEHAVWAVGGVAPELGFLAIGRNTAKALQDRGLAPVSVPPSEDSSGIIHWLESHLPKPAHAPVVLYTGVDGTQQVEDYLRAKGIEYRRENAYRRVRLPLAQAIGDVDVIIASSGEALEPIRTYLQTAGLTLDIPLLVPSRRVLAAAQAAGFSQVILTNGASPEAVLQALGEFNQP